jgi:hypothetical protein
MRLLWTEHNVTHRRMNAVGPHEQVNADVRSVLERCLHMVPMIGQGGEPVPNVQAFSGQSAHQRIQEVGTVHLVVGKSERGLHCHERCSKKRPAVIPAALVNCQRLHAHVRKGVGEA